MSRDIHIRRSADRVRVSGVADRCWGRIHWTQLRDIGIAESTLVRWAKEGYLHRRLPGVYAVGHVAGPVEADLAEALLYAGPGAMLSHATAAWWWGLTQRQPSLIDVSTPRHCRSLETVKVHGRRDLERVWERGLTVTTVAQTLLDYASRESLGDVRYVLAEADYHRLIDLQEVRAVAGRGRAGSAKLRQALEHHWPDLARARSKLERDFLFLVEAAGLPRPQVNVRVCGFMVDCYWPEQRVVVELDGPQGHSTQRQIGRDRGRELKLRAIGIVVRRYAPEQVYRQPAAITEDLRRTL